MVKRAAVLLLVMTALLVGPVMAGRVVLQDGEVLTGTVSLDGGFVTVDDRKLDKSQVKEIFFRFEKEIVTAAPTAQASGEIKQIIDEANAFADKWPEAGAVLLVDDGLYSYSHEGTWKNRFHTRVKILKEEFKNSYSIGGTGFVDGRARANVVLARTIKQDGRVIDLDPNDVRITKPSSGGDTFVTVTTLMFTFPEVEVGDIVESIIEQETYNPAVKKFFFPLWLFQSSIPVLMSQVQVEVPKEIDFKYRTVAMPDSSEKPAIIEKDDLKSYTWRMDEIDPYIGETMMPNVFDILPSMRGAIIDDWAFIADWVQKYWKQNTTPSEELIAFTKDLTKDDTTPEDKIARIYHWLQKNIRYIIIKGDMASIFGSWAGEVTLERKFGCCVDKAVLMSSMLTAVGVKSTPVLLNVVSGNTFHPDVPQISIQHSISCVYLDGRKFYLDSTGSNYRYPYFSAGNHGVWCLNPLERQLEFIDPPLPRDNAAMYRLMMDLEEDGDCRVVYWTNYTGSYEAGIRGYWKRVKESERPLQFANMVKRTAPTARLEKYRLFNLEDISKPFSLSLTYTIDKYPTFAGDLVILELPDHNFPSNETGLDKREFPLRYYGSYQRGYTYIINLPDNMSVYYLPDPLSIETPYATYSASYRKVGEKKIIFKDIFRRLKDTVPAEDYELHKQMCREIDNYTKQQIFLVRENTKGGE